MGKQSFQKLEGLYVMRKLYQLKYVIFYQSQQIPMNLSW